MTIIVRIGQDEPGESTVGEQLVGEPELGMVVGEMITDPVKLDKFVPGASAKAKAMAEANGDADPEFPVIRVEEGWSESKRLWTAKELDSIAAQVNMIEPVAHLGHIKDEDESTAFPDPQTTWLKAVTKVEPSQMPERKGEMVNTIYVAGYNYADAKIRGLLKRRAVKGTSFWGRAQQVPIPGKGVEVKGFKLKTIDWARKNSEGMRSASVVTIAKEMDGGTNMDKPLSAVTPEEFEKENPNGYALIVAKAKAESDETVAEMEAKVKEGDTAKSLLDKIRDALGLPADADPLDTITQMATKLGGEAKALVAKYVDAALLKKVPDEKQRGIVKALLPVGEMEAKASDAKDAEAVEKLVGEMTDAAFDKDDNIKTLIGEMQPAHARRREEFKGGTTADAAAKEYGMSKTTVTL